MLRVKSAETSLAFYQETMGMRLLRTNENPAGKFNLYFLAYPGHADPPSQAHREGLLELTWNYGTENDADFSYHDGNAEPQGFGHIAVSVDDLEKACARFDDKGVRWKKRLTDGRMKNVAFVSASRSHASWKEASEVLTCARSSTRMDTGSRSFRMNA